MAPEGDDTILHEADVEKVVDQELEDVSTRGVIDDVDTPSSTYVEAEAAATVAALNAVLAVLRDAKLIPTGS